MNSISFSLCHEIVFWCFFQNSHQAIVHWSPLYYIRKWNLINTLLISVLTRLGQNITIFWALWQNSRCHVTIIPLPKSYKICSLNLKDIVHLIMSKQWFTEWPQESLGINFSICNWSCSFLLFLYLLGISLKLINGHICLCWKFIEQLGEWTFCKSTLRKKKRHKAKCHIQNICSFGLRTWLCWYFLFLLPFNRTSEKLLCFPNGSGLSTVLRYTLICCFFSCSDSTNLSNGLMSLPHSKQ